MPQKVKACANLDYSDGRYRRQEPVCAKSHPVDALCAMGKSGCQDYAPGQIYTLEELKEILRKRNENNQKQEYHHHRG